MPKKRRRYIFIAGGVMSGVGKGVTTASLGALLQGKGQRVTAIKIDPYINVDAGTMNPTEHGEVFVTDDGDETDQDIGNYERFLNQDITRVNYMTTGRVYQSVIQRERNLEYEGICVEVVPHIPEEVIKRIKHAAEKADADITLIEIGGTVGEYQNILFLEAARMMKAELRGDVQVVLVSYLPVPSNIGEMKTKPTQYAMRTLNAAGLQADFIIARAPMALDLPRKRKLSVFCSLPEDHVISAPDVESIYDVPLNFDKEKLGEKVLAGFGMKVKPSGEKVLKEWRSFARTIRMSKDELRIGVVGKYFSSGDFVLSDAYISVIEALKHAAWQHKKKPVLVWINAVEIEKKGTGILRGLHGIVVPQGWGSRGSEGKIMAIRYARENKVPYFGLCYGMQMAVVEFARNVLKLPRANSSEVDPKTPDPVIHVMPDQQAYLDKKQYGGTIRLGAWECKVTPGTNMARAYGKKSVSERHRHRYEFNNEYRARMEAMGLTISGTTPDGQLVEAIEIKDHPFFVGVQFHPEYKTRPFTAHPLFTAFMKAAIQQKSKRKK
jgi:CTP synthase